MIDNAFELVTQTMERQYPDHVAFRYVAADGETVVEKTYAQYAEDIRVKNKVIREVRKEALLLLNDDIDMTDFDGETQARAKFLTAPLDRMVAAKEISRAEVTIPDGQAETFLETGLLRVRILYLSRGYIREIEIEVGRTNVSE